MSSSNVTKTMAGADLNSEGKPYHDHEEQKEKNQQQHQHRHQHEPAEHVAPKDHTPHGHDNQYHKDIKGSVGSGSSERGDRKADKETK